MEATTLPSLPIHIQLHGKASSQNQPPSALPVLTLVMLRRFLPVGRMEINKPHALSYCNVMALLEAAAGSAANCRPVTKFQVQDHGVCRSEIGAIANTPIIVRPRDVPITHLWRPSRSKRAVCGRSAQRRQPHQQRRKPFLHARQEDDDAGDNNNE